MRSGLKLLLITLPVVALGVGFLAYTVVNRPPPQRSELAERATAVRVIVAQTRSVSPQITGFGRVSPARTYEAIAQVPGTADYVNPSLKKGAILPAGTVLLRLSPTDFNLAVAQARANIRAAEARLAELDVTKANLTAALKIEKEELALKAADLERTEALLAGGTVPQKTRDAARTAHLVQRQKVQSVQSSLALMPTQRAVQTEQIAAYQAALETATLNLGRTELTLPFAARVASVSVEIGQFVRAGATIALLDGIGAAEVEAQVSVADLRGLLRATDPGALPLTFDPSVMNEVLRNLGLRATVRLRLGRDAIDWPASVDRISDTIDQKTGTLGVIVRVENAYSGADPGERPPLTKGMFVEVALNAPPVSGIVVPRNALRDGRLLLADADSRLVLAPVARHMTRAGIAVIRDGVAPGARIVVSAISPAMAGMLLEVTEDTALMDRLAAMGQPE